MPLTAAISSSKATNNKETKKPRSIMSSSRRNQTTSNPQWFGSAVTIATNGSQAIPYNPFPSDLRIILQRHFQKARTRRQQALEAIRTASTRTATLRTTTTTTTSSRTHTNMVDDSDDFDAIMDRFLKSPLSKEGDFSFDTNRYPLREAFQSSCGIPLSVDLSRLHDDDTNSSNGCGGGGGSGAGKKLDLLHQLTLHPEEFQTVYDEFVRHVCCPKLAKLWWGEDDGNDNDVDNQHNNNDERVIYYQCFPCVRIVSPGEFSIGPHADVTYGHHPLTTNVYVLLTDLSSESSSAALFLESRPGAEDWHPIVGKYGELVKHFAGAICTHWTTENNTNETRVSLDFRLLPGPLYHSMRMMNMSEGGGGDQTDRFRKTKGFYAQCTNSSTSATGAADNDQRWVRMGPLLRPDARVGFPWTVSDWEKLLASTTK